MRAGGQEREEARPGSGVQSQPGGGKGPNMDKERDLPAGKSPPGSRREGSPPEAGAQGSRLAPPEHRKLLGAPQPPSTRRRDFCEALTANQCSRPA